MKNIYHVLCSSPIVYIFPSSTCCSAVWHWWHEQDHLQNSSWVFSINGLVRLLHCYGGKLLAIFVEDCTLMSSGNEHLGTFMQLPIFVPLSLIVKPGREVVWKKMQLPMLITLICFSVSWKAYICKKKLHDISRVI